MCTALLALTIALVLSGVAIFGDQHTSDLGTIDKSDPATTSTPLSTNPFALAREGEWSAYVERITEEGRAPLVQVACWRVVAVEGDKVTTRLEVRPDGQRWIPGHPRVFSRAHAPTIGELFAVPGVRTRIEDVRLSDESMAFEARSFPCKRIAFTCRGDDAKDGTASVAAWVTPAIPGSGFFGLSIHAKDATSATTIEDQLAGFGRGTTAELGMTPDQIDLGEIARRSN